MEETELRPVEQILKSFFQDLMNDPKMQGIYQWIELMSGLAEELGRLREDAGLTQEELAELSGVSRRTIVALEGMDANPRLNTLSKLAVALGKKLTVRFE